jgi:RNA polymerase sigma factor (sigma-70 family)
MGGNQNVLNKSASMKRAILSAEEEERLIRAWKENKDEAARDAIISAHMRMCYALAARWTNNETHIEDLAQEGFFGLLHALDKFDPEKGKRFGPYARWWAKTSVEQALSKVMLSVEMPARVYRRARLAEKPEGQEDVPWEARVASNGEIPLDAQMAEGEDTLMDIISDEKPNPEQDTMASSRLRAIKTAIEKALSESMTPREAEVLRRRDLSENPETLEVIAESMGVSRERIRQIQNSALSKLRRRLIADKFPVHLLRDEF